MLDTAICSPLLVLKNRLKIKRLTKLINNSVKENFGYSPDYEYFDKWITDRIALLDESRVIDSEWCDLWDSYERRDEGHSTPLF